MQMTTDDEFPLDDPLRRHLSGKRQWTREITEHLVEIRGPASGFLGQVLDLSRGGIRLAVVDPTFYDAQLDGLALVSQRFPHGALIRFVEGGISRRAEIVRITPHQGPWLSIGCRFDSPLTGDQAVQLGMSAESLDEDGVAPSLDGS